MLARHLLDGPTLQAACAVRLVWRACVHVWWKLRGALQALKAGVRALPALPLRLWRQCVRTALTAGL